jgi:hypothetical protein
MSTHFPRVYYVGIDRRRYKFGAQIFFDFMIAAFNRPIDPRQRHLATTVAVALTAPAREPRRAAWESPK